MSSITVNNQYINNINWQKAGPGDGILTGKVDIWRINITESLPYMNQFRHVLNPAEIIRANKYLRQQDRERFVISRGSLRYILAGYLNQDAAVIQFQLSASGKPFIAGTPVEFNLSDTDGCVLIAVASSAIGVDVECIKPGFAYQDIISNYFSAQEAAYINERDSLKRFFLLWTRKEALLKATGVGLVDDLHKITALDGPHAISGDLLSTRSNWQLQSFDMGDEYIATIVTGDDVSGFRFWEMDMSEFKA